MSLTRKFAKGAGLTDDQADAIIEEHMETVNALKAQVSELRSQLGQLQGVQKELDELRANANDGYEEKYKNLEKEYSEYKERVSAKETHAAKESAYRALLKEAGISEKRIPSVLKVTDIDGVTLTKDGTIKDADKLAESVKSEWADFIQTTEIKGADTSKPPANNGGGTPTKEDIMKIKDPVERQSKIAENIGLFRKG